MFTPAPSVLLRESRILPDLINTPEATIYQGVDRTRDLNTWSSSVVAGRPLADG